MRESEREWSLTVLWALGLSDRLEAREGRDSSMVAWLLVGIIWRDGQSGWWSGLGRVVVGGLGRLVEGGGWSCWLGAISGAIHSPTSSREDLHCQWLVSTGSVWGGVL